MSAGLFLPATASARWAGTLSRLRSDPSGRTLLLELATDAKTRSAEEPAGGSLGLHFGLKLAGYTVMSVDNQNYPGAGGYPPCAPTRNADLATGNAGIDCSFGQKLAFVSIKLVLSARYPTDGEGLVYDEDDKQVARVLGPDFFDTGRAAAAKSLLDEPGRFAAVQEDDWAYWTCNNLHEPENTSVFDAGGLGAAVLANILSDRQACYVEIAWQYHLHGISADPPDPRTRAVATLAFQAIAPPPACPRGASASARTVCQNLRGDVARRDADRARYDGLLGAIYIAMNRLSAARNRHDDTGTAVQEAALGALESELLDSASALDLACGYLSADLSRLHEDPQLSPSERDTTVSDVRSAAKLPAAVLAQLRRHGIPRSALRATLPPSPTSPAPLRLRDLLDAGTLSKDAVQRVRSLMTAITPADFAALAQGLRGGRAITAVTQHQLATDAARIASAHSAAARARAIGRARTDAAHVPGEAGTMLSAIAQSLA